MNDEGDWFEVKTVVVKVVGGLSRRRRCVAELPGEGGGRRSRGSCFLLVRQVRAHNKLGYRGPCTKQSSWRYSGTYEYMVG